MPATVKYLSLSEVARKFNVSYGTALKLYTNGVLKPDAHQGRTALFEETRSEELRTTIRINVITYSPREASDFVMKPTHPLNIAANLQA